MSVNTAITDQKEERHKAIGCKEIVLQSVAFSSVASRTAAEFLSLFQVGTTTLTCVKLVFGVRV